MGEVHGGSWWGDVGIFGTLTVEEFFEFTAKNLHQRSMRTPPLGTLNEWEILSRQSMYGKDYYGSSQGAADL